MATAKDDNQQSSLCKRGFIGAEAIRGHTRSHGVTDGPYYEQNGSFKETVVDKQGKCNTYFWQTTANRFLSSKAQEASCDRLSLTWPAKFTHNHMSSWLWKPEEKDESCASSDDEEDLANSLVLLSNNALAANSTNCTDKEMATVDVQEEKGAFQCKACKKIFSSHQALGGHRASHKKVKGCFASGMDNPTNENMGDENSDEFLNVRGTSWEETENRRKKTQPKVHQCSICYRTFSSGQALGGHKRCHWLTSNNSPPKDHYYNYHYHQDHDQENLNSLTNVSLPSASMTIEEDEEEEKEEEEEEEEEDVLNDQTEEEGRKKKETTNLSELRDMDLDGKSSTWLHLGIAPNQYFSGPP